MVLKPVHGFTSVSLADEIRFASLIIKLLLSYLIMLLQIRHFSCTELIFSLFFFYFCHLLVSLQIEYEIQAPHTQPGY